MVETHNTRMPTNIFSKICKVSQIPTELSHLTTPTKAELDLKSLKPNCQHPNETPKQRVNHEYYLCQYSW